MNTFDSDLEEGEIIDSPPPSPHLNIKKRKELPERYVIKDSKTPIHKHKKSCKHAIRHHTKKLSKVKKFPSKKKNSPKIHHKPSCSYEKSHRVLGRHNRSNTSKHTFPKKNGFHPQNSFIDEMKDSLKNVSPSKKLNNNFDKSKSQHISLVETNCKSSKKDAVPETSSAKQYKNEVDNCMAGNVSKNFKHDENTGSNLDSNRISDDDDIVVIDVSRPSSPPLIDLSNSPERKSPTPKLNSDAGINVANITSNNSLKVEKEESEDEEELRRIALATCAKRKALKKSENIAQNTSHPLEGNDLSHNAQILHKVVNNREADNYEVVDMDIDDNDDDMQDSLETAQISVTSQVPESTDSLFVIDTHPSYDFLQNKKKSISELQSAENSDDEDFQASILREEIINTMYRKKLLEEGPKQSDTISHEKRMPVVNQKKFSVNYHKHNLQYSYKRVKSAKHFLRKRSVNKLINTKNDDDNKANKAPLLVPLKKSAERIIITVNGESSDDSDEEENNPPSENPLDSISALISDCRQKSEFSKKTEEIVPKAVECLSKAQQEEYNSLKRILATKAKLSSTKGTLLTKNGSVQNGTVHSPLDDLNKLEKKLVVLRGDLRNKIESIATLSEEVTAKKLHYMKAKLTTQHLKEQLVAAEKVRKAKLLEWSKTCESLKSMKQSVSDLENKMNEVQNLCSKLGSSLQGQSYKLPLLSSGKGQL